MKGCFKMENIDLWEISNNLRGIGDLLNTLEIAYEKTQWVTGLSFLACTIWNYADILEKYPESKNTDKSAPDTIKYRLQRSGETPSL